MSEESKIVLRAERLRRQLLVMVEACGVKISIHSLRRSREAWRGDIDMRVEQTWLDAAISALDKNEMTLAMLPISHLYALGYCLPLLPNENSCRWRKSLLNKTNRFRLRIDEVALAA